MKPLYLLIILLSYSSVKARPSIDENGPGVRKARGFWGSGSGSGSASGSSNTRYNDKSGYSGGSRMSNTGSESGSSRGSNSKDNGSSYGSSRGSNSKGDGSSQGSSRGSNSKDDGSSFGSSRGSNSDFSESFFGSSRGGNNAGSFFGSSKGGDNSGSFFGSPQGEDNSGSFFGSSLGGNSKSGGGSPFGGLGGMKLPFPLDPAQFLAMGLSSVFGPGHLFVGMAPMPNVTDSNGKPINVGPMFGGIVLSFGPGITTNGPTPKITIKLELKDVKLINMDAGFALELDPDRPGEECTLVTMDPIKVMQKFMEFANPMNWPKYISEFASDPMNFFKKTIEIFKPFGLNLNFNVKSDLGPPGSALPGFILKRGIAIPGFILKRGLINANPVVIKAFDEIEFPPKNIFLSPEEPVVLVEANDTNVVHARIETFQSMWIHPGFEEKSEAICQAIVRGLMSFSIVREFATKFLGGLKIDKMSGMMFGKTNAQANVD